MQQFTFIMAQFHQRSYAAKRYQKCVGIGVSVSDMNVFLIFEFLFPAILYDFCHSKNGSKIDEKITLKSNLNLQIFGLHLQIVYSHVMSGLVVEPKTR